MNITDFLLARIAERERAAREWDAAYNNPGPAPEYHYRTMRRHRDEWPTLWRSLDTFTPARVLAECEAKRRIVTQATDHVRDEPLMTRRRVHPGLTPWAYVLRTLAQPYADHPDFDPAWA